LGAGVVVLSAAGNIITGPDGFGGLASGIEQRAGGTY